jgi:hypothetical protein
MKAEVPRQRAEGVKAYKKSFFSVTNGLFISADAY